MFKNLMSFSYERNWKEAIGFYLAYFLLGLIFGAIAGALTAIVSGGNSYSQGYNAGLGAGAVVSVVFSLVVSALVLKEKRLYKNFGYIVLAFLSGVLASFGGSLLGLIIPAVLTTKKVEG